MLANAVFGVKPRVFPRSEVKNDGAPARSFRLSDWLGRQDAKNLLTELATVGAQMARRVATRHQLTLDFPDSTLLLSDERLGVHHLNFASADGVLVDTPTHFYLDAWPVTSASVGLVVIGPILHACADPKSLLREAARVLEPGGVLLLLALNPASYAARAARLRRHALQVGAERGDFPTELLERPGSQLSPKRLAQTLISSDLDTMYIDYVNAPAAAWRGRLRKLLPSTAPAFALLAVKRRPLLLTKKKAPRFNRALQPLSASTQRSKP